MHSQIYFGAHHLVSLFRVLVHALCVPYIYLLTCWMYQVRLTMEFNAACKPDISQPITELYCIC